MFLFGAAWLIFCALIFTFQRHLVFPAPSGLTPLDPTQIAGLLALDVSHADGRTQGWLVPAVGRTAPGPVVIYTHGNGELIDQAVLGLEAYQRWGVSLALLEYRGYGQSDGEPSEAALVADALVFYDQVAARPEVDPSAIILHGRSLGGGIATAVAAQRPARALILASTFTSIADLAWRLGLPGFLVRDPFDSLDRLPKVRAPIFISHGRADEVVPFAHGEALAARAGVPLFVQSCGHNDCEGPAYWAAVGVFLEAHGVVSASARSRSGVSE